MELEYAYLLSTFDHKTLYVAGNYVFKSTDRGDSWKKISGDLTRQIDQNSLPMMGKIWPPEAVAKNLSTSKFGNIFALSESPLKQGMLYAGTDDGLIWITEDDGENWTKYDQFPGVPGMTFVNYVTPSMHDENTVYACFDGRKNSSDFTPYLIKSTDKGKTWESIASNLPSGTVYCIIEDHQDPDLLFVGTEWGVWTSIDGGKKWAQIKNGIPTIQVKELTIQERENDLVVATFGRGFYVLDNYSSLRELNKDITEKEAHLFTINDAMLYFPSSNLNYQGEIHFRTPNPDPEARFEYYIKKGYKTLKQKRIEAQKEAEKEGKPIYYPTEAELRAEENEKKPELIFTIYDANGDIMRKIKAPVKEGYNSLAWDLGYLSSRGPKVPPGEYTVAIDKNFNGTFTRLAEPQPFKVFSVPNALGTPNYTQNFNFYKELNTLNAKIYAARSKMIETGKRLENMQTILEKMPVEASVLINKINGLQSKLDTIQNVLFGGYGMKNPVSGRVRFALYASSNAQVDVTGTQQEQYHIAHSMFEKQETALNELFNNQLPALEKELEKQGGILYSIPPTRRW